MLLKREIPQHINRVPGRVSGDIVKTEQKQSSVYTDLEMIRK